MTDGGISATANLRGLFGFPHCPWAGVGSLKLGQGCASCKNSRSFIMGCPWLGAGWRMEPRWIYPGGLMSGSGREWQVVKARKVLPSLTQGNPWNQCPTLLIMGPQVLSCVPVSSLRTQRMGPRKPSSFSRCSRNQPGPCGLSSLDRAVERTPGLAPRSLCYGGF